jgi:hypothetical protein
MGEPECRLSGWVVIVLPILGGAVAIVILVHIVVTRNIVWWQRLCSRRQRRPYVWVLATEPELQLEPVHDDEDDGQLTATGVVVVDKHTE